MCTFPASVRQVAEGLATGAFEKIDSMEFYFQQDPPGVWNAPATLEFGGDGTVNWVQFVASYHNNTGVDITLSKVLLGYRLINIERTVYACSMTCSPFPPGEIIEIANGKTHYHHWKITFEIQDGDEAVTQYQKFQLAQMLATGSVGPADKMGFFACKEKNIKNAVLIAGGAGTTNFLTERSRIATPLLVPRVTLENSIEGVYHTQDLEHRQLRHDEGMEVETTVTYARVHPCPGL